MILKKFSQHSKNFSKFEIPTTILFDPKSEIFKTWSGPLTDLASILRWDQNGIFHIFPFGRLIDKNDENFQILVKISKICKIWWIFVKF